MNLQIFLLSMFLIFLKNSAPQQQNISQIEFATFTRGFHKNIIITKDNMSVAQQSQRDVSEHISKFKIRKEDWNALMQAMKSVSLVDIGTLPSPGMQRASDAARSSTISITDDIGKVYSHTFDNEDPNEKLKPLLKSILAIEQRTHKTSVK